MTVCNVTQTRSYNDSRQRETGQGMTERWRSKNSLSEMPLFISQLLRLLLGN